MSKQQSKLSKIANRIAGILMLFGLSYCTYLFGTAEWRVKKLCPQMVGLSYEALTAFGKQYGLNSPFGREGITFMVESKSYGRWGCEVEMRDGKVVRAEYHFSS